MSRTNLLTAAVAAAALATLASAPAVSNDDHGNGKRRLKATLSGYNEMLQTLSTPGRGSFSGRISRVGDEISWRLEYSDVPGTVTQAHIHFGDHHTNGGISVWLCANNPPIATAPAGTDPCPNGPGPNVVTGTAVAADVVGPAGQGIAASEFEEFVRAIRAGRTYANVHTVAFPGGEIRGQIKLDD